MGVCSLITHGNTHMLRLLLKLIATQLISNQFFHETILDRQPIST